MLDNWLREEEGEYGSGGSGDAAVLEEGLDDLREGEEEGSGAPTEMHETRQSQNFSPEAIASAVAAGL